MRSDKAVRKPISFVPVHLIPQDTIQHNWQNFRDTFGQAIDCLEHDLIEEILRRNSFYNTIKKKKIDFFFLESQPQESNEIPPLTLVTQREAFRWSLQQLFIRSLKTQTPSTSACIYKSRMWPLQFYVMFKKKHPNELCLIWFDLSLLSFRVRYQLVEKKEFISGLYNARDAR